LKHFARAYPGADKLHIVIISDQAKGLGAALPKALPKAKHCHYAQHICDNFMQKFHPGDAVRKAFWQAVKAPTKEKFDAALDEIGRLSPDVDEYLRKIPFDQ
jgi:hypothetical protein